jgi:uncharacterized protein
MSLEVLDQTFRWVFASGLVRQPFTLLWHAGEPLVMPIAFYEAASELLHKHNVAQVPVLQSFQTNATRIDAAWCAFLRRPGTHLGVSVDGPAFLHDPHRRTRQGRGTLDRVLHGIDLLHQHDVPFEVITVLTAEALACPDELFDFYEANGIHSVAFNVEEIEGPHKESSLQQAGTPERFRRFLTRFLMLARSADPPLLVREFDTAVTALLLTRRGGPDLRAQENTPWAIVNVDCMGNFSTYSPELLGVPGPAYDGFTLGNVAVDSLATVIATARYCRLDDEIGRGVAMCRDSCSYFRFCGGGPPGNKYFENGTFASTETLFCRLHKKICIDVALELLERDAREADTSPGRVSVPQVAQAARAHP